MPKFRLQSLPLDRTGSDVPGGIPAPIQKRAGHF